MSGASASPLRIAVIGGGPAGSFFALYALKYARLARRDIAITIYEAKDFRRFGQPGCNMCAGIIPTSVLRRFGELDLKLPAAIILNHINTYSLHTTAGTLNATQPDADADIVSVYRGVGPRYGHPPDLMSFDELLLEQALTRGVKLRRALVQEVRRGQANENLTRSTGAKPIEVVSDGEGERYDLVVLATGVNSRLPDLRGFGYRPPPTGPMCQIEFHLGSDEVQRRLGASVHIFLPPDE
ncbi:MAG: hypothetical protein HYY04_00005, partial [Chloroflexi bacterium]|nr:hypothetical protein [Chloroflexota bacterium]